MRGQGTKRNILYNKGTLKPRVKLEKPRGPSGQRRVFAMIKEHYIHIGWIGSEYTMRLARDWANPLQIREEDSGGFAGISWVRHEKQLQDTDIWHVHAEWEDVPRVFRERCLELCQHKPQTKDKTKPGYVWTTTNEKPLSFS